MNTHYLAAIGNSLDLTQTWNVIFLAMLAVAYVLYRYAQVQAWNDRIAERNKIRRLIGEKDLPRKPTVFKVTWRYTKYASAAVIILAVLVLNKFFPSS